MAQVNVIAKSNVVTESEHESALEQISYLETSSVQRSHQVPFKLVIELILKKPKYSIQSTVYNFRKLKKLIFFVKSDLMIL
jgi:hypothetical protein